MSAAKPILAIAWILVAINLVIFKIVQSDGEVMEPTFLRFNALLLVLLITGVGLYYLVSL